MNVVSYMNTNSYICIFKEKKYYNEKEIQNIQSIK